MARSKKTVAKTAAKKPEEKTVAKKRGRPSQASAPPSAGSSSSVSRLRALYVDLASDLDKLSAFVADPHAFAKREALSEEDTELLFSGDQGKIYASLRPEMMATPVPIPPQPQQSTGEAGAATQAAAPAPVPPLPQGYPCASQWPMTYAYGWPSYWPSSQSSFVQTTSSCPAEQPPEQKGEANV